jgi:hypothetical protein
MIGARAEQDRSFDGPAQARLLADAGGQAMLKRDQARMLYAHGARGLIMTMVGGIILVLMVSGPGCLNRLLLWLGALAAVLCVRAADILVWHPARRGAGTEWDGQAEIGRFAAGTMATALVWAMFTLVVFPVIGVQARLAATIVTTAMAFGSPMVLASYLPLALVYSSAQIIPPALFYLGHSGRESQLIGLLGLLSLPALALAARTAHRHLVDALRLGYANALLVTAAEQQARGTEAAGWNSGSRNARRRWPAR